MGNGVLKIPVLGRKVLAAVNPTKPMSSVSGKNAHRFGEIDGLRGIAALIVLISHYTWAYDYHFNLMPAHRFHFLYGDLGVEIFFIISGFVIYMTLNKVSALRDFAMSRFSRLYPTYWLCMLITLLVITVFPVPTIGHYSFSEVLMNFTMVQGVFNVRHIDQVYWSLEVELFFYVIMALIFWLKKPRYTDYLIAAWLLLAAASAGLDFPLEKIVRKLFILRYAPLFISGIAFYRIKTGTATMLHHLILPVAFLVFCLDIKTTYPGDWIPLAALLLVYLIFYAYSFDKMAILRTRILLFFGSISYPLYLLHNVIGYAILYRLRTVIDNQFLYCILTSAVTIPLAWLVTRYFDQYAGKWVKGKWQALFSPKPSVQLRKY